MTNKRVKRNINKELMFNKIMPSYQTPLQNNFYRDNSSPSYGMAALKHEKTEIGLSDELLKHGTAYINRDAAVHTPASSNDFPVFGNETNSAETKRTDNSSLYSQNNSFIQKNSAPYPIQNQVYMDNQPGSPMRSGFTGQPEINSRSYQIPNNVPDVPTANNQITNQYQNTSVLNQEDLFSEEAYSQSYDPSTEKNSYLQTFMRQMTEQKAKTAEQTQTAVNNAPVPEKKEIYTSYERAQLKDTPKFINITKQIVYSNLDEMMKKFNCCTCNLCKQAVILDTLNNVKAEYVFKKHSEVTELIKDKDMSDINKQLIHTIVKIKANPPHNK